MASGRQVADFNLHAFIGWRAGKTDADFRQMVVRGVLSRKGIAAECGFAKSALAQNPRIKLSLAELERALRERGVLPPVPATPVGGDLPVRAADQQTAFVDAECLRRLEQDNASLRAENADLRRHLARYAVLSETLAQTGRLPR